MDCSLLGSSVHGICRARILEWVTTSCSRGSSRPRDRTRGLPKCRQTLLTSEPPGKASFTRSHAGLHHSQHPHPHRPHPPHTNSAPALLSRTPPPPPQPPTLNPPILSTSPRPARNPNAPSPAILGGVATGTTPPRLFVPSPPFPEPWETQVAIPRSREICSGRKQELGLVGPHC